MACLGCFFFLFAGFSLENALNSKLCLNQDFWSLTILLVGWAGTAYGEPFVTVPLTPSPTPPLHFMVHRSMPINDFVVYTHILHITVLETNVTCIFTQQAHDLLIMSMQRCINVSLTLSWSHVPAGYLFIFTQHRRRGTIEMSLICLCVHPSILHSIRLSVCAIFFHNYNSSYIFHRTDLKFYRLPSYHMKMCMWFLIFVSDIFYQVMALADSYLVPATPATSFIELA